MPAQPILQFCAICKDSERVHTACPGCGKKFCAMCLLEKKEPYHEFKPMGESA